LSVEQRKRVKNYINECLSDKIFIDSLAELLHLSPFHFARMFKQSFGDSPANYVIRQRVELAKQMFSGNAGLSYIAAECGFTYQSHFNNYFKKHMGVTPSVYRKLLCA